MNLTRTRRISFLINCSKFKNALKEAAPLFKSNNNKVEKVFYRDFTKGDCLQSLRKITLSVLYFSKFVTYRFVRFKT